MAQINHKAVRSLSKLMEAGFDSEKAVLNMTMERNCGRQNVRRRSPRCTGAMWRHWKKYSQRI